MIITSNKGFDEWTGFPDNPVIFKTLQDRTIHKEEKGHKKTGALCTGRLS
jgi:hypothetical protein